MVLIITFLLFSFSFIIHVLWWRIKAPKQRTLSLLLLFFIIPAIALCMSTLMNTHFHWFEIARLLLLYTSCTLVYIILYSAIEQQSPTLSIVGYIHLHKQGCNYQEILQYLCADNEINKRLLSLQQGKWIKEVDNHWQLTTKGTCIAYLFEYAAAIFGLRKGG